MTDQAIRVVPAGWYEDPASAAHVRWWNGLAWTEHTAAKPAVAPEPQPARQEQQQGQQHTQQGSTQQEHLTTASGSIHTAETLARIAAARDLEREYGVSTDEHELPRAAVDAARDGANESRASRRAWERTGRYQEPSTSTASAWFIALWPLLTLAAGAAAAYLAFYVMPEPSVAGVPVAAALVLLPSLLTLVWAVTDARRLRAFGYRPASPALALLGPLIYLIGRRVRVAGSGSGPLVTLIVLTLLAIGAPVAAFFSGAAVPVTKALEIQQEIHADLVEGGRLASVSCPVFVEDLTQGSLYTCNGTLPDGRAKTVWVSIETSSGEFAYALAVK